MTNKYIDSGDSMTITAAGAVTHSTIYVGLNRCGVYKESATTGDLVAVALEGTFQLTKTAGATQALSIGELVYSTATGAVTVTASGGVPLGHAVEAAATGDTTAKIKLGTF